MGADIRDSVSAEQRPGFEPALPIIVPDDVIDTANGRELSSLEDLADTTTSRDGQACRTKGVILHAFAIKENVVANKKRLLENIEGETRGVAIDMKGFDAVMNEVFFEGTIEGEGAADFVDRVIMMNPNLCSKEFPIEVRSAKKVVVGEENRIHPF